MKKLKLIFIIYALFIGTFTCIYAPDSLIQEASKLATTVDTSKIFTTLIEEKQRELEQLKTEHQTLEGQNKALLDEIKAAGQEVKSQLQILKDSAVQGELDEFNQQKRTAWHQLDQTLKETSSVWEKIKSYVESRMELLEAYLKDSDLVQYKHALLKGRSTHTFEDFQQLYQRSDDDSKKVEALFEKEKNITLELLSRRRAAEATKQAYEKKKEEFRKNEPFSIENQGSLLVLDAQQRAELWKLEEKLFQRKQQLDALRLQEFTHKIELTKLKRFIAQLRRDATKEVLAKIKLSINISEADVALARDELSKKQQQAFVDHERYTQIVDKLIVEQKLQERALDMASRQYNMPLDKQIQYWAKEAKQSVETLGGFVIVGHLYEQLSLTKRKKDLLRSQQEFEEGKLRYEKLLIEVKDTFRKIMTPGALSEYQIIDETKKYETLKAEAIATISHAKERENSVRDLLDRKKRDLIALESKRDEIQKLKNTLFKTHQREYTQCIEVINNSYEKVKIQIEIISRTVSIYADCIEIGKKMIRQIFFITKELATVPIVWHRPEYAITWNGLKNFPEDLYFFAQDIWLHATTLQISTVLQSFYKAVNNQALYGWLLFKALALFVIFIFVKLFGVAISQFFLSAVIDRGVGLRIPTLAFVCCLDFILMYTQSIFGWCFMWIVAKWYAVFDPYPFILFSLLSIAFLSYLFYVFVNFVDRFNKRYDHPFWDPEQKQLMGALACLLYASIILLVFRQAFVFGSYRRSEVPAIVLAISIILLQISLALLIVREIVANLIPSRTDFGRQLSVYIERYYYFIMSAIIAIIIMSNPYIGYGRLVLHLFKRFAYTVSIICILFGFHFIWRKMITRLFLFDEPDMVKERFSHARTWYGFSIIVLFLSCVFVGMLCFAKIWGWPEVLTGISSWEDITKLSQTPFMLEKTATPISIYSILHIIFFIAIGFIVSSVFNRFVLERIYDILTVDAGVQNTISSLSRYLVITGAVILGFQAVGLSSLVAYLVGALIIGIGWVVKDPISDVLAYFIILVQRPIKVGDLVQVDSDILGVVRKITPRSVIVRKKNSTTVVIPNMMILHKPITNWNYVRGFVAFDDIMVTISYDADPNFTRELLFKVLGENPYILKNPKPVVRLDNFGEYGYMFMVRGYFSSNYTLDMWDIASDVRLTIVKTLKEHNITIAIPVRIVVNNSSLEKQLTSSPE